MSRCRVGTCAISIVAVAAIFASCGGGDDDGGVADATPDRSAAPAESAATEPSAADSPPDEPVTTEAPSESDAAPADEAGDGGAVRCDSIFSMAEMEAFFAEPVDLTEETNDSLGQLVCTWESIEDPDDTEDLAFQLLVLQYYSGSPIPAAQFFDPNIFESVTTIDGVGELGYSADDLGTSYYFYDDPVGGSLSYSEVDMGDLEAPKQHTADDVEQLFRTFHDRVT